jgi:uncharacterized integral membrane protein
MDIMKNINDREKIYDDSKDQATSSKTRVSKKHNNKRWLIVVGIVVLIIIIICAL